MPSETPGHQHRFCAHCGAAVGDGRFCGRCGTELPASDAAAVGTVPPVPATVTPAPTGPPAATGPPTPAGPPPAAVVAAAVRPTPTPMPSTAARAPVAGSPGPSKNRRWLAAGAGAAALLIALVVVLTRGGGDDTGAPATTRAPTTVSVPTSAQPSSTSPVTTSPSPPTTAASVTTAVPATSSPVTPVPTTPPPTAPPIAPGARYIGLVFDPLSPPPGVTEIGGSVVGAGGYVVAWMQGPEGDMFWLEQVTLQTERIEEVLVTDVVLFPPLEQDVGDVVVFGSSICTLDGAPVDGVVGIFPYSGQEWMTDPYAVWWVDEISGTFVELPATTTCIDEGYGV